MSTSTTPTRELQIQLLNCIVSSLKENLDIANQELAETRSLLQSEKALSTEATATLNATKLELDQSRLSLAITQDELITSQESLASTSKSLEETKELVMETQKISAEAQELARDFSAKLNASLTSNDELLRIAEVSQEEFRKVGEELRGVVEEKEKRVEELTMLVTEQNDKTDDLTRLVLFSSTSLVILILFTNCRYIIDHFKILRTVSQLSSLSLPTSKSDFNFLEFKINFFPIFSISNVINSCLKRPPSTSFRPSSNASLWPEKV